MERMLIEYEINQSSRRFRQRSSVLSERQPLLGKAPTELAEQIEDPCTDAIYSG